MALLVNHAKQGIMGTFRALAISAERKLHGSSTLSAVKLKLSNSNVLIDDKVNISVSGLAPKQPVTLQTFMTETGKTYGACGHYVADKQGRVNTFSDQSHGGTFTGVEPMGLFWSMKTIPGVTPGRLFKADVMKPFDVSVVVHQDFREFETLPWSRDQVALAQTHLYRSYTCEGVKRIDVEEDGLHGTLFLPSGDGPFPAALDMFGFTGGIIEHRSALLASRGIASFSLAYVDHKELPKDVEEIDLKYFLRAFDWLVNHSATDSNATGIVATCVGAGYGLFIASKRPNMKCLVSVNGTCYPVGPVQVVEGEKVVPSSFPVRERYYHVSEDTVCLLKVFEEEGNAPVTEGWRNGAPILFVKGEDDQCINPTHLHQLRDSIPEWAKPKIQFVSYPGAGHLLEPPYAPWCGRNWNNIFKSYCIWGGSPKPHADAQEDSWKRILTFLRTHLQCEKNSKYIEQSSQL